KDATRKAMGEISSAIIGITLVLTAVFIPMAFMPGSVGVIYQQFSISMAVAIVFSAFLALSLTPALCATLLKPIPAGSHPEKRGFFGWFNRSFERFSGRYEGWVSKAVRRTGRCMFTFLLLVAFVGLLFSRLPSSFLP
ncbi:efflux RND transporter permease subunit, partial [Pseudomonas viridiflava]|uniref:efflux RND transporter permease subunit n=1 Tax=Pseudomonas viridiflava TaxID=33069 RepID=UPI0013CEB422